MESKMEITCEASGIDFLVEKKEKQRERAWATYPPTYNSSSPRTLESAIFAGGGL